MYALLMVIHVVVSLILIAVILLQAGHGGGIADAFGGGSTQSVLGTRSTTVLNRATAVCAGTFLFTSLVLAVLSGNRTQSLMERVRHPLGAPPAVSQTVAEPSATDAPSAAAEATGTASTADVSTAIPLSPEATAQFVEQAASAVVQHSESAPPAPSASEPAENSSTQ